MPVVGAVLPRVDSCVAVDGEVTETEGDHAFALLEAAGAAGVVGLHGECGRTGTSGPTWVVQRTCAGRGPLSATTASCDEVAVLPRTLVAASEPPAGARVPGA